LSGQKNPKKPKKPKKPQKKLKKPKKKPLGWVLKKKPGFFQPCYKVCNRGEGRGGDRVVWRASTGVIHCVIDQIPNLQNCFTTSNKNLGGEGASDR
jgi:hypothetical protein